MDTRDELTTFLLDKPFADPQGLIEYHSGDLTDVAIAANIAAAILASPVVAHIRAEALREAANAWRQDGDIVVSTWLERRADREEQGA